MTNLPLLDDPNIVLPPAVKRAAAAAQSYYEEASKEGDNQDAGADNQQQDQAPAPEAAKQADQPVTSQVNQDDSDESYKHKYLSNKGRWERSEAQVRDLSEQVASLQQLIASLQMRAPASQNEDETKPERLITDDEVKDYGEDFLKVVGKKAKEELNPEVAALKREIADLKSQLAGVGGYVAQDARQRMHSYLDQNVPNWQEINYDENFKNWLRLPDAYSGAIRHDMLKAAYAENNAPRVLAFFKGFLAEEAALAPAGAEPDPKATTVERVPLETLAAPGRAKTAAGNSGAPAEKPIFTRAQIAKFYADSTAGKYRGKEKERDALERQIFEAERDGRIR